MDYKAKIRNEPSIILFACIVMFCNVVLCGDASNLCKEIEINRITVHNEWRILCELYKKCWRNIDLHSEGVVVFTDATQSATEHMTDEENRQYLNIVKDENLLEEIQNPLSPKCIGWDRFSDLHIEIGFTNGASIKTKWAAGCLNLEDHIFKRIADFAIELKNKYIECDEFSHEIFEDDFDINDLRKVEEALPTLQGKSVIGLCFPCGGKC